MQTVNAKDLPKLAQDNDYKFIRLSDQSGNIIVPWNGPTTKIEKRITEIQKRISHLPAGIYQVTFKNRNGKSYPEFPYFINIGNVSMNENSQAPIIIHQSPANTGGEPVRGWNDALKDKETIATQNAQIQLLEQRLKALEENAPAEEEEEEEEETMSQGNAILTGLREIVPQFLPLADTWRELQLKKMELEERRLMLAEKGINTYTPPQSNQQPPRMRKQTPFRPLPEISDENRVESYLTYLEKLPDAIFEKELQFISENSPELYNIVVTEFYSKSNEDQQ